MRISDHRAQCLNSFSWMQHLTAVLLLPNKMEDNHGLIRWTFQSTEDHFLAGRDDPRVFNEGINH